MNGTNEQSTANQGSQQVVDRDLCVVVQGPVIGKSRDSSATRVTQRGLASIRRHLPGAQIILSTWEGADVQGLDFDRLVLSPDPGPDTFVANPTISGYMNVTRMIASTVAGLRETDRAYALKARSDLWVRHAGFLKYVGRFQARADTARVFSERILVPEFYSRNPDRSGRAHWLFHPGDCFQCGRTEDMLTLWTGAGAAPIHEPFRMTLGSEQFVWVRCLSKFVELNFTEWSLHSESLRKLSDVALANNFVVLNRRRFGLESQQLRFDLNNWIKVYTHGEWRALYREHCDPNIANLPDPVSLLKWLIYAGRQWLLPYANRRSFLERIPGLMRNRR